MHIIRLKHPWRCALDGALAVWRRSFNWPAGLVPREVVWLVVEPLAAEARVELNGQTLTTASPDRFDITNLITETNRLVISTPDPTGAEENQCPLNVRLEIDEG